MKCALHGDDENTCKTLTGKDQCIDNLDALDSGNFISDELYNALDNLYERGWIDKHKEKDYDPRGTKEWQLMLDIVRAFKNRA